MPLLPIGYICFACSSEMRHSTTNCCKHFVAAVVLVALVAPTMPASWIQEASTDDEEDDMSAAPPRQREEVATAPTWIREASTDEDEDLVAPSHMLDDELGGTPLIAKKKTRPPGLFGNHGLRRALRTQRLQDAATPRAQVARARACKTTTPN